MQKSTILENQVPSDHIWNEFCNLLVEDYSLSLILCSSLHTVEKEKENKSYHYFYTINQNKFKLNMFKLKRSIVALKGFTCTSAITWMFLHVNSYQNLKKFITW